MNFGALKKSEVNEFLPSLSTIRPKRQRAVIAVVATLMLTSLVDVFSILVMYLLVNTSASKEAIKVDQAIKLPQAYQSSLITGGVNLEIVDNRYYVNKELVKYGSLYGVLSKLNEELEASGDEAFKKIIIQADKATTFDIINPILLISSEAGFENIKFATMKIGS